MEHWIRRNRAAIPWVLLGVDLGIRLGVRLYKTYNGYFQDKATIDSPAQSLVPELSAADVSDLPYPPDAFPGARDVVSPYGSLRVYEWGPEDGRRVLFVHGITNPCPALGGVAHGLVDRGCRVILFDLPGRGYSSTPESTPQSSRLFTTCILLAITSSPIPWTGTGRDGFNLIGYSLGGGIAADFASHFPFLVSSLILFAPAGLVRTGHLTFVNKMIYNYGVLYDTWLERVVSKRLKSGGPPITPRRNPARVSLQGEVPQGNEKSPPLSRNHPSIAMPEILHWQIEANRGFVKAFISSLRYGPISNQHEVWRRIGQRLDAQRLDAGGGNKNNDLGLQNGKVLIICGKKDAIIIPEELKEDAAKVLGDNNFELKSVDAGHDLPITKSKEIVDLVWEFWQQ